MHSAEQYKEAIKYFQNSEPAISNYWAIAAHACKVMADGVESFESWWASMRGKKFPTGEEIYTAGHASATAQSEARIAELETELRRAKELLRTLPLDKYWRNEVDVFLATLNKPNCSLCLDSRWVCEAHMDTPWCIPGASATCCSAPGVPCPKCNPCDRNNPPAMGKDFIEYCKVRLEQNGYQILLLR